MASTKVFVAVVVCGLVLVACHGTRDNPATCFSNIECGNGMSCSTEQQCEPIDGGDGGASDPGVADADTDVQSTDGQGDGFVDALSRCRPSDCTDPMKPVCGMSGKCEACSAVNSCAGAASGSLCSLTGACVVCLTSADCTGATPICSLKNTCVACNDAIMPNGCAAKAATPVCATAGGKAGQCVECLSDTQCAASAKPICDSAMQACRGCAADSECQAKSTTEPGICMSHEDGRCATAQETVVVIGSDLPSAIKEAVMKNKALVVVKGDSKEGTYAGGGLGRLAIVGSGSARPAVGGGTSPGIMSTAGTLYLRHLVITLSKPGLVVKNATLQMQDCDVSKNSGGILLDGANFTIENTSVSKNDIGSGPFGEYGGIEIFNPGMPKVLRNLQVLMNEQTGIVCNAPIDLDPTSVTATGNVGSNITPACKP